MLLQVLSQYDVLLSFDGVDIANDGTVPFRTGERIAFSYLVSQKYTNESAKLRVLHDGQEKTVTVKLQVCVLGGGAADMIRCSNTFKKRSNRSL